MNLTEDELWQAVAAERRSLADLLDGLSPEQWDQPSLCTEWTVREVAAHLTQQALGFTDLLGLMVRWRGTMDRTSAEFARRHAAAHPTGEIVATLRGMAGSRRHTLVVTPRETLIDVLVHTQDITVPLGIEHAMPLRAAAASADRALSMRWPRPLPATRRMAGLRLAATDLDWHAGEGPEVRGPISAILLACCGRDVALAQLSGPGLGALTG